MHSFDPDPVAFHCLSANIGIQTVIINQVALGSNNEIGIFYSSPNDADSSLVKPDEPSEIISVPIVTMDTYLREKKLSGRFLLKMDAEGAEQIVLQGFKECLSNFKIISARRRINISTIFTFNFGRGIP